MNEDEIVFNLKEKENELKNSPRYKKKYNIWTEDEILKKTQGYLDIFPEYWNTVKPGSFIKYMTKDDELKQGVVYKNPMKLKDKEENIKPEIIIDRINTNTFKLGIVLKIPKPAGATIWTVRYENIKKIYVKLDAVQNSLIHNINTISNNISVNLNKISQFLFKLDQRINLIEDNKIKTSKAMG